MTEMATSLMIISMKTIKFLQPMMLAISILTISIVSTFSLFHTSLSSWISFVVILTFSSGMMTLFMYTTSFSPNEKMKNSKGALLLITPLLIMTTIPMTTAKISKQSMKTFTSMAMFLIMGVILIVTMLSISNHGHHPNQTISSSF